MREGDFTHIRIETGFCYLAAILDACSRKVVGYTISRRIDMPLALAALHSAVRSRSSKLIYNAERLHPALG